MKKIKILLTILIFTLTVTGCSLAREDNSKDPLKDEFVGILVRFQTEEENLEPVDEDKLEDIKLFLVGEGGNKYLDIKGIDGHVIAINTFKEKETDDYYTIETVSDNYFTDIEIVSGGLDGENMTSISAKVYLDASVKGVFITSRIYKTKLGDYYIGEDAASISVSNEDINEEINEGTVHVEDEYTGKKSDKPKNKIDITAEAIFKGKKITIVEMDSNNVEVGKQEFDNTNIPNIINIAENTEYVIVEEVVNDELTKRKIFNLEEDTTLDLPVFSEGNIAEIKYIQFAK